MPAVQTHIDGSLVLKRFRRIVVYSRVILVWHVTLAVATVAAYLWASDLSHFAYWRRAASSAVILMAAPVILPYVVSYVSARRIQTPKFLRVAMYLATLTIGCGLIIAFDVGAFGVPNQGVMFVLLSIQAYIYYWSGRVTAGQ